MEPKFPPFDESMPGWYVVTATRMREDDESLPHPVPRGPHPAGWYMLMSGLAAWAVVVAIGLAWALTL